MAEQRHKHKKPGPIRRIAKWLGAGVLAILLILALVYQAPWKVIALQAVFLAAYAALPYPAQKWLWLCVAVVLSALVTWIFLPDGDDVWVPFTFTEELTAHEASYTLPENQNAAVIYNKLLQDFVPNEWRIRFLRKEAYEQTLSEPWLSGDYPALSQWLDKHGETLKALPAACRIKTCRFPSDFRMSPSGQSQTHRYSALKSWALVLVLSGNNDVAEGRPDEAFPKYIDAIQIAEHLYQQKRIHDFLIGFGIEGIALPRINRFLVESNVSEKQLQLVAEALGNLEDNWSEDFSRCFEYDRLLVKNTFCSLVYQTNAAGRVRLSRDPLAAILGPHRTTAPAETYWQEKSMKAYIIPAWFFFPATPRKAAEMIDTIFKEYHPISQTDFAWDKEDDTPAGFHSLNCRSLIRSLIINRASLQYGGFHDIYPRRLSQRRGTRILIALKQYNIKNGRWPENLDAIKSTVPAEALVDPQNSGPFAYKLSAQTFTLYSKGKNGRDDQGRRGTTFDADSSFRTPTQDDLLFWPPNNSKAGEENAVPNPAKSD